jgi:uncharacterized protein (UPF0332 family)
MTYSKEDLIKYRLERAEETLKEAKLLAENEHWNTVANRLYYACYYGTIGLFVKYDFSASTHSGVKTLLGQHFIKTQILSLELGKLYNDLFNKRQEGDYQDFQKFNREAIEPLIAEVEKFIKEIRELIDLEKQ